MMKRSETFAHSRDIEVLVDQDDVLGYAVFGGGRGGSARVWPIYRGEVRVKTKNRQGKPVTYVFSTYEKGQALNGQYFEDVEGAQFASIAAVALNALEDRARLRPAASAQTKKTKAKARAKAKR